MTLGLTSGDSRDDIFIANWTDGSGHMLSENYIATGWKYNNSGSMLLKWYLYHCGQMLAAIYVVTLRKGPA